LFLLLEVEGSLLTLKEVEGFCFYSWRLKVIYLFLERLKAFVFALKGWRFLLLKRLKVFAFAFECWRFLLFLLNIESPCSYFWMLKVLTFIFYFLIYCFYSWMFKVLTFGFKCWKFLLLLLNIEDSCLCCFYVIRPNFHYFSIHQHQNYVYKVRFFQKYLKL
jgi:hypothetical protein